MWRSDGDKYIFGYCTWVCVLYLGATDSGPRLPYQPCNDRCGRLPPDRWWPPVVTGVMIQSDVYS